MTKLCPLMSTSFYSPASGSDVTINPECTEEHCVWWDKCKKLSADTSIKPETWEEGFYALRGVLTKNGAIDWELIGTVLKALKFPEPRIR